MDFNPTARFRACRQLASSDLGGEAVILNLQDGKYYGLNPVGAAVWQWMDTPQSLHSLTSLLTARYQVDDSRARADLQLLIPSLLHRKLIEIVP